MRGRRGRRSIGQSEGVVPLTRLIKEPSDSLHHHENGSNVTSEPPIYCGPTAPHSIQLSPTRRSLSSPGALGATPDWWNRRAAMRDGRPRSFGTR